MDTLTQSVQLASLSGLDRYLPILFSILWVVLVFSSLIAVSKMIRPKSRVRSVTEKNPLPWSKINMRYQILLAISVLFSLAVLFLYPAAAVLRQQTANGYGLISFLELSFFLGTLSIALAYAWKKGDLTYGDS